MCAYRRARGATSPAGTGVGGLERRRARSEQLLNRFHFLIQRNTISLKVVAAYITFEKFKYNTFNNSPYNATPLIDDVLNIDVSSTLHFSLT